MKELRTNFTFWCRWGSVRINGLGRTTIVWSVRRWHWTRRRLIVNFLRRVEESFIHRYLL